MGLSPELFERLSRLNRKLMSEKLTTGDRVERSDGPPAPRPADLDLNLTLEQVLPGVELETPRGRAWRVTRLAHEFIPPAGEGDGEWLDGPGIVSAFRRTFLGAGIRAVPEDLHENLRPLVDLPPGRAAYLDIESCGLAGEPLFLIGLMRWRDDTLAVDQYLARDYAEEGAVLAAVWDELGGAECLITFNGKSFDIPSMNARSMACGLFDPPEVGLHVDLLHEARRRWKAELPNCRLQTLEQMICGRRRVGDIPGADIPAAYHDFVRAHREDEDPWRRAVSLRRLQTILHHNALDLVTMAELLVHILGRGS